MLRDDLRQLSDELISNHPNIDNGGCCVVAAFVGEHLQQLGIPVRIACGNYYRSPNLDAIRRTCNRHWRNNQRGVLPKDAWVSNGVDLAHVLVEFKENGRWYTFDATNGPSTIKHHWSNSPWNKCRGFMTVEEAQSLWREEHGWCEDFNRRQIPTVKARIKKFFKFVDPISNS